MNDAETIQAAIDKLTMLQADSVVGPWEVRDGSIVRDALGPRTIQDVWVADIDEVSTDAHLIVTLHRTIDAQLAILNHGIARATSKISTGGAFKAVWSHEHDAVALAKAILGDDS